MGGEGRMRIRKHTVQPTSVLTKASVWYQIGVLWADITHVKSHAMVLGFCFKIKSFKWAMPCPFTNMTLEILKFWNSHQEEKVMDNLFVPIQICVDFHLFSYSLLKAYIVWIPQNKSTSCITCYSCNSLNTLQDLVIEKISQLYP